MHGCHYLTGNKTRISESQGQVKRTHDKLP